MTKLKLKWTMEFEKVLVVQDKICIMSSLKLDYIFSQNKGTFNISIKVLLKNLRNITCILA